MEDSLRTPFIIRWPKRIPAGRVTNEIVREVDTFPTFARIAGSRALRCRRIARPDHSSDHLGNFRKRAQADGWNRSEIDRMEVIYTQVDKAHLLLWFRRLRADGSLIGAYHSLYIITEVGGHWGIQGGSGSGF